MAQRALWNVDFSTKNGARNTYQSAIVWRQDYTSRWSRYKYTIHHKANKAGIALQRRYWRWLTVFATVGEVDSLHRPARVSAEADEIKHHHEEHGTGGCPHVLEGRNSEGPVSSVRVVLLL